MRKSFIASVLVVALATGPAFAAPDAPKTGTPSGPTELKKPQANAPAPTQAQFEEAQRRYARAIELFNEGSFEASLLEFRRAYELAPTYKILYNVAQVNVQLLDYARALDYFERYLEEGGTQIEEARKGEVKKEIARLTERVAQVTIKSNVDGAQISVDDLAIGTTPLKKPLRVNSGKRRITLAAKGKLPSTRAIEIAGGDSVTLDFDLHEPTASPSGGGSTGRIGPREKSIPWVAWAGTAVLAVGAGVCGVFALGARSDLKDEKDSFDPSESDKETRLEDLRDRERNWALATDVLAGSAVVLGGVAIYLTLSKPSTAEQARVKKNRFDFGVGPRNIQMRATF